MTAIAVMLRGKAPKVNRGAGSVFRNDELKGKNTMKRAISLAAVIALMVLCFSMETVVRAGTQEVTLSPGGSLADALDQVADGGTIQVNGTVAVTKVLGTHAKHITVTGGTLDFSGFTGDVHLGDHITFENITLTFVEDVRVYANGYAVTMGNGVTMPNPIQIFGGKDGGTAASTHLTLLSGKYSQVYGGSHNGNIIGDTYLYVGGNVNADVDVTSHSRIRVIYGGSCISAGLTKTIGGTAYTVFTDNAKANYLYGGNYGSGTISGGTDIRVCGGATMAVYGANGSRDYEGNAKLLISGGTMEQVFGGSEGGSVNGNVAVDITGGTITRRVYGGCYNEYDGSWSTSRYVNGEIYLTLHSGANISFSSSQSDKALYAHSRHATASAAEVTHLVFADATAYNTYKNKVKAQDGLMQSIMGSVNAADHVHYHTYTASGAVITQNCIDSSCSATATLTVENTPVYNGVAVEPAKVIYSGNWCGGELEIAYANNDRPGSATASVTCGGATATLPFEIVAPSLSMNGVGYASLEAAIAAARETEGADTITLLQDVEVSAWVLINTDVTITAEQPVTISAADSQTGGMFRIISGSFTVEGASEDAKITLAAGKNTTQIISNNGGNVVLTNVALAGNENAEHKTDGIFNKAGTVTAKSVDIANMTKGDGIFVMDNTTVNLDNVTVSNSGRYGIKVKGTLNISNSVHNDHALSVSGSADHAIDVENGGQVACDFDNVPAGAYVINLFENMRKGLNVRRGANAELSYVREEN